MKNWLRSEDEWAVGIGLLIFVLALLSAAGIDVLGWAVATKEWRELDGALGPVSGNYVGLSGPACLLLTFLFLLSILSLGAWALKLRVRAFALSFTGIFAISFACWLLGHFAYIAATPDKRAGLGVGWS